jgi:hypothetical protein
VRLYDQPAATPQTVHTASPPHNSANRPCITWEASWV